LATALDSGWIRLPASFENIAATFEWNQSRAILVSRFASPSETRPALAPHAAHELYVEVEIAHIDAKLHLIK
jgi:hypothetical protein